MSLENIDFYRGSEENLPASEIRNNNAFYITLDTGKMFLGDIQLGVDRMQDDLVITSPIGVITQQDIDTGKGSHTLDCKGKTFEETLNMLTSKELEPTITQPSLSVSGTTGGTVEIGTKVTPSYTLEFDPGSYQYGPATGITLKSISGEITGGIELTMNSITSYVAQQVQITGSSQYQATFTYSYTAGSTPVTNKGTPLSDKAITAGTKTTSATNGWSAYRMGLFWGTSENKLTTFSSNLIRSLDMNHSSTSTATNKGLSVPVNTATIIIAAVGENRTLTKVYNKTVNADMTSSFVRTTAQVEGNNGYTATTYTVWYYSPDSAYTTTADLEFTIK